MIGIDKNKMNERLGKYFKTNEGYIIQIIDYKGTNNIDVIFCDGTGYIDNTSWAQIKRGKVDNPYRRSLHGVGYLGVGKYKTCDENGNVIEAYKHWSSMIKRCYDERWEKSNPCYKDCFVCNEWHNFQNFAEWHYNNYYEVNNQKMVLDKDFKFKNNKIYSPETCIYVPQEINNFIAIKREKKTDLPPGVRPHGNKYRVNMNFNKKKYYIGLYNTKYEAFEIYKIQKKKFSNILAEEYKNEIPKELYDLLINYEVDIC